MGGGGGEPKKKKKIGGGGGGFGGRPGGGGFSCGRWSKMWKNFWNWSLIGEIEEKKYLGGFSVVAPTGKSFPVVADHKCERIFEIGP